MINYDTTKKKVSTSKRIFYEIFIFRNSTSVFNVEKGIKKQLF